MSLSRDAFRWLLRPLGEPAFLYLYLADGPLPFRCFADAFWSLEPEIEHPEDARTESWRHIEDLVGGDGAPRAPAEWFVALLRVLRDDVARQPELLDLVRYWSLPELFPEPEIPADADRNPDYHEIHCHLRGAVPYASLWEGWLTDERWRAALRGDHCKAGRHHQTWAELVAEAAAWRKVLRAEAPADRREPESRFLSWLADQLVSGCRRDARGVVYLAVCTALRRFLIHQRGRTGLSEFHLSYERYSRIQRRGARDRDARLVRCVLEEFQAQGAAAVELRPTLERRRSDLQRKLRGCAQGYFDYLRTPHCRRPVVMGLVPSLYKQEGLDRCDGEPRPEAWQRQAEVWCDEVEALLAVLDEVPVLRYFVVGIDAAGRERGCPPRALAPAFQAVRRYNVRRGLRHARPGRGMSASPPALDWETLCGTDVPAVRLGITVHAGEDFEDPMTGLRHVWEALVQLDLGEGDRIGHALAAGLDGKQLCTLLRRRGKAGSGSAVEDLGDSRYRVTKPRGEHLLDLAWRHQLADGATAADAKCERRAVGHELAHFAAGAFGMPVDPDRLARSLTTRGPDATPSLPGVRYADPSTVKPEDRCTVILDEAWFDSFERLRRRVLTELVCRRVVVECCPTSNHVIANIEGDDGPLQVFAMVPGLRCALGTDDPGLLDAWPEHELRQARMCQERLLAENARASFAWLEARSALEPGARSV